MTEFSDEDKRMANEYAAYHVPTLSSRNWADAYFHFLNGLAAGKRIGRDEGLDQFLMALEQFQKGKVPIPTVYTNVKCHVDYGRLLDMIEAVARGFKERGGK